MIIAYHTFYKSFIIVNKIVCMEITSRIFNIYNIYIHIYFFNNQNIYIMVHVECASKLLEYIRLEYIRAYTEYNRVYRIHIY